MTYITRVFGREMVAFVAVGPGPLCKRLRLDLGRLAGFRSTAEFEGGALEDGAFDGAINIASAKPARQDNGTEAHE